MNFTIILASIALTAASLHSRVRPAGCPSLDALAASLKAVNNLDWDDIDEAKLQSIWFSEIEGIQCDAGACETMGRRDRVIDDKCQCCELFNFNIERNNKGDVTSERLETIVLYYSALSRDVLLHDAKALAASMGLPASDVAAIGSKTLQDFDWTVDKSRKKTVALLQIRLHHQDGAWTVYFHLSRQSL